MEPTTTPSPTTPSTSAASATASQTTAARYEQAHAPLRAALDAVPADRWSAPSPCEGWSAADVVRHLVDTQRDFLAQRGIELGDAPDVDADPAAAWRAHAEATAVLLVDGSVPATPFDGWFGPTTIGETLERFYVFDMVVHRWDVARATGVDESFTDEELDQIEAGIESFGDNLYLGGICAPAVEAQPGAARQEALLAKLGRRA